MKSLAAALVLLASPALWAVPPAAATELKDVEFAKPAGVSLTLDAWIPPSAKAQPAVILVHGGGWNAGTKRTYINPWFPTLTDAGIAWFTINYRLAPQWKYPAAPEDVEAAVTWVQANAKKYNIDPKRIALMGESAGGHLVALVGARGKVKVKTVVDFYGPNDLPLINQQRGKSKNLEQFLPDGSDATYKAASPATYIHKKMPPFLFIHGTADKAVPWQQSPAMCDQMKAAGARCEVLLIEGAPHGVEGMEKNPAWQTWKPKVVEWLQRELR
ncbi:MAG: alpha/beta hydrolase [Paludibaculum sp.]